MSGLLLQLVTDVGIKAAGNGDGTMSEQFL
jgi:hypothetical protein